MLRECTQCQKNKELVQFAKSNAANYRYICKECWNEKRRTGKPNTGRFKKGYQGGIPFEKGHIPWSKLNKGLYFFPRKSSGRGGKKYTEWRKQVKERDGNKCTKCGSTQRLHAHHILEFENNLDKRFDLENGTTLCVSCHNKIEPRLPNIRKNYGNSCQ